MLYKRLVENERLFFVHIPRTGGRFINSLLHVNSFKREGSADVNDKVDNIPIMHLPLNYLQKDNNYIRNNKFSIVRNPYTRYQSLLKFKGNEPHNFFAPQTDYIENKTIVYKYENGLNENFCSFIKEKFKIKIQFFNVSYDLRKEDLNNKKELTDEQISFVNKNYKEDFIRFNYEKF